MMPQRVQRKRVKGWRMPLNCTYVGRPTAWGNPFGTRATDLITVGTAEQAVEDYRNMILRESKVMGGPPNYLRALRGRNLACWCSLSAPCHADVLLELANAQEAQNA